LGKYPVVIIDYLQILAPAGKRLLTDKQNMDRTVKKLKALSKNLRIPIIAISSLNRDSYNASVSMASFKESGSIEYSSDVLLGLQYKGIGGANFDIEKAEAACERNLELKILKNRHGEKATINFKFFAKYSYFKEQNESNNNVFKKY
jgi:replicative DNA helicase